MQKLYMTLLVHKQELFQLLITYLDFCLLHYLLSSDSETVTFHKVSSLDISFFKTFFKKTKLILC